MSISQIRDSITRMRGEIADLLKKQSRERENKAKISAAIANLQGKVASASKTSSSSLQSYQRQLSNAFKDLAKVDSNIADLEKKIVQKQKESNRQEDSLTSKIHVENQRLDSEEKKRLKQREETHKREVARLREITNEINRQNSLRAIYQEPLAVTPEIEVSSGAALAENVSRNGFTAAEIDRINEKLDLVLDALQKLGYGQEIIFNEIDEMRSLTSLSKKNWMQTLKGKLFEMAVEKTLEATLVPKIIDAITTDMPNLLEG